MTKDSTRETVKEYYAERAQTDTSCCGPQNKYYSPDLIESLPADVANFTLGCGDPISLANLQPGETVVDLGSGGGLDCFLAAKQVGEDGLVIGIDMTPEMLERATQAAKKLDLRQVEFRKGFLEGLPVDDNSVDVVISNCVINLSPDKPQVFSEIYRVLKDGGRISVSDIVTVGEIPENILQMKDSWSSCAAGALPAEDYIGQLEDAGFIRVDVKAKDDDGNPTDEYPENGLFSGLITAYK